MSEVTVPVHSAPLILIKQIIEGANPTNNRPDTDPAEPYTVDLRGKGSIGRLVFGADTKPPFFSVIDVTPGVIPTRTAGMNQHKRIESRSVFVQGFARKDEDDPILPAHEFGAIVMERLARITATDRNGNARYAGDYMLQKLITDMRIGQPAARMDPEIGPTAFFYLLIEIDLIVDVVKPYATISVA